MRIAIVALEGSLLSAIAGLSDLFWMTNQTLRSPPLELPQSPGHAARPEFETVVVSADGNSLRDPQGRLISVDASFRDVEVCDAVLVTGMALAADRAPPLTKSVMQASDWISACHQKGAWVGGDCAGTFVLGEAGLLDRRRCTTTWWLHHVFKRRFPRALPVWGSAMESHDQVITTGGPLSWIDLALQIIRNSAGVEIARLAADISVADSLPLPQSIYAPRGFINGSDPFLLEAEQLIRRSPGGLTALELAKALHVSDRTLHRRLKHLTNESPKELITRVRIETACVLLQAPSASIKQVALECGYNEDTSFRRAFTQITGMNPAEYRRWAKGRIG